MLIVKIEEKEWNLPESWSEVNLKKFEGILRKNTQISEYKSQIKFSLEILSILLDCRVEDLHNLTKESFETLTNEIAFIKDAPIGVDKELFIIGGKKYKLLKDLNKLKMGDNISLELMIKESTEADLLINILPILLREVKEVKVGDDIEQSLCDFDAEKYAELKTLFSENIFITEVINFKSFF